MKRFAGFFLAGLVACILACCEGFNYEYPDASLNVPETDTITIDSRFVTSFTTGIIDNAGNTELIAPVCRLEQAGSGMESELGDFSIYLSCCWSLADGAHTCTEGYISDIDGYIITVMCREIEGGVVFSADFPYDQAALCAGFEFTGGTGVYERASGQGVMECEIDGSTNTIMHHWKATLILLKQ